MQIGGLGFVHSLITSKNMEQANGGGVFSNLLINLSNSSDPNHLVPLDNKGKAHSEEIILDLIQMINTNDLSELDPDLDHLFPEMTESFLGNEEMIKVIQTILNINDIELKSSITTFLKNINLKQGSDGTNVLNNETDLISSSNILGQELDKLIEKIPEMDTSDAFLAFVQILPLIPLDQITFKMDEPFSELIKSLKLFDLISSNNLSYSDGNNIQLKKFLQTIGEKLDEQSKMNMSSNRRDILFRVFTPVVKEIQNQASSNQPLKLESVLPDEQNTGTNISEDGFSFQQMSKPEQLMIFNSQTGKQVSVEQLMKQFETILSKGQFLKGGENQKLFIKLYPEHLGALRVELIQHESGVIAKLLTTTQAAKEILESQIQSLKQAFSSQNIQIERIEISSQLNNPERFIQKDPQQQEQRQQHQQQEEQKENPKQSFTVTMEETLLNLEV